MIADNETEVTPATIFVEQAKYLSKMGPSLEELHGLGHDYEAELDKAREMIEWDIVPVETDAAFEGIAEGRIESDDDSEPAVRFQVIWSTDMTYEMWRGSESENVITYRFIGFVEGGPIHFYNSDDSRALPKHRGFFDSTLGLNKQFADKNKALFEKILDAQRDQISRRIGVLEGKVNGYVLGESDRFDAEQVDDLIEFEKSFIEGMTFPFSSGWHEGGYMRGFAEFQEKALMWIDGIDVSFNIGR